MWKPSSEGAPQRRALSQKPHPLRVKFGNPVLQLTLSRPFRAEYRWKRNSLLLLTYFTRARFIVFAFILDRVPMHTPTCIFQYDLIRREHVVQLIQRRKSLAPLRWNSDRMRPPSSACFAKVLVFAWATTCVTRQWGFRTTKVAPPVCY